MRPAPAPSTAAPAPSGVGRRAVYVDSMRVYGVLLVLVVHVSEVFNPWDEWHITNVARSRAVGEVAALMAPWLMPMMMLLAGVSSWYSLRHRGNGDYLRERTVRVLLPLVIGTLLLVPPQVYLERLLRGQFSGSFIAFYPTFFHGVYPRGNLSWHHLWFLAHLYGYAILALPIFRFLQSPRGARVLQAAAGVCSGPAGFLWLALPLVVERALLWGLFPERHMLTADWSNHALLFVAYLYGFVLAGRPWLGAVIDAHWRRALAVAAVGSAGIMTGAWIGVLPTRLPPPYTSAYLAFWALYAVVAWAWMAALLGFARWRFVAPDRIVRYGAPRAYLWYIVHQPVVVAAAYVVVRWHVGIPVKIVALTLLSVGGTLVASAALSRVPMFSALFGGSTGERRTARVEHESEAAFPPLPVPGGNLPSSRPVALVETSAGTLPVARRGS